MSWFWSILGYSDVSETVSDTIPESKIVSDVSVTSESEVKSDSINDQETYVEVGNDIEIPDRISIQGSDTESETIDADTISVSTNADPTTDTVSETRSNIVSVSKTTDVTQIVPTSWDYPIWIPRIHPICDSIKRYWADKSRDGEFIKTFKKLKTFIGLRSRMPSIRAHNKNEKNLARWLESQKKRDLSKEERELLGTIPLWNYRNEFLENCNLVKAFTTQHNRIPVSSSMNSTERYLGLWLYRQLKMYQEDKLDTFHIDTLRTIPYLIWSI